MATALRLLWITGATAYGAPPRKDAEGRGAKAGRSEVILGARQHRQWRSGTAYCRLAEVEAAAACGDTNVGLLSSTRGRDAGNRCLGWLSANAGAGFEHYHGELILHAVGN